MASVSRARTIPVPFVLRCETLEMHYTAALTGGTVWFRFNQSDFSRVGGGETALQPTHTIQPIIHD